MFEYIRDGHPTYHWDAAKERWRRTREYDFYPPTTHSETLAKHDEASGTKWLLETGWSAVPLTPEHTAFWQKEWP